MKMGLRWRNGKRTYPSSLRSQVQTSVRTFSMRPESSPHAKRVKSKHSAERVVNLSRAFCDPRPRSYQFMSAASSKLLNNIARSSKVFILKIQKEFYNFRKRKYFQIYGPSFQYRIYHQRTNMTGLYQFILSKNTFPCTCKLIHPLRKFTN